MGFVNLFQTEVYSDIHVEPLKAVETDVLQRVQEFDSADAHAVADRLMTEPATAVPDENAEASIIASLDDETAQTDPEMQLGASLEAATDEEIARAEAELGDDAEDSFGDESNVIVRESDKLDFIDETEAEAELV